MMYWDGGWSGWTWLAMAFSMVIFWTAVGVVIWLLVRRTSSTNELASPRTSAEDVLRHRFAAGEIDEEEFDRRMSTLRQHSRPMAKAGTPGEVP
jgi:putative membrane protein